MKLIRLVLGKVILLMDRLFQPQVVARAPEIQTKIDLKTQKLQLFQFVACPFCVKVRRAIKRLNLKIELKDAKDDFLGKELVRGGGQLQVPCLRIESSDPIEKVQWLYESDDIIAYLERLAV